MASPNTIAATTEADRVTRSLATRDARIETIRPAHSPRTTPDIHNPGASATKRMAIGEPAATAGAS